MAKEKITITVDRGKLTEARTLLGARSSSAAVDAALSQLIRRARIHNDIAAYTKTPATEEEAGLGQAHSDWADLADDVDWDAEWPAEP